MTKSATIFSPAANTLPGALPGAMSGAMSGALSLAILVLPQASILEVASVLDPLRSANRHLGAQAFRWRVVSAGGQAVPLTCGLELPSSGGLETAKGADVLVVIAGYRQAEVATKALVADLRRAAAGFAMVVGLDAGPWVMARAGLLSGHRATLHWEDLEDFAAKHPDIDVVGQRYVISGNRATVAGAAPAVDFLLHLIEARHGAGVALQVANSFLTSPRPGNDPQIAEAPGGGALARDPRVRAAIARMEQRLDAPEPVARTARALGLSVRRLEGLFRDNLGTTPAAHCRDLRLQAARRMLVDTGHDLTEIAMRTGFSGASALGHAFRARFGMAPGRLRRAAQPRGLAARAMAASSTARSPI